MGKEEKIIAIIIMIILVIVLLSVAFKETSDIDRGIECGSDYFGGTECY